MTHQLDQDRERKPGESTADRDAAVPGRRSASAALSGPTSPVPSGLLLRKGGGEVASDADAAVARASSTSGHELPGDLRSKFESSLGTDLGDVRIHAGPDSHHAADAVGARAYATGNDIHFGAGQYDPHSHTGQELIAHEVAHTVQQRGGAPAHQNKLAVSHAGDSFEREADSAAAAMVTGTPFALSAAPGIIARAGKDDDKASAKAGVSPDVGKDSVGAKVDFTFKSPKVNFSKFAADAQVSVKFTGNITLKSVSDDGAHADPNAKKLTEQDALAAGEELGKKQYASEGKPEGFIEDWDVEVLDKDVKPVKGKIGVGIAPTLILKARNGTQLKVGVKLIGADKAGPGKPIELEILKFTATESVPLWKIPEGTKWNDAEVSGGIKMDVTFDVQPNKTELAGKILTKLGPRLLGSAATEGAEKATEALASLPLLTAVAGTYITIKSTLATLKEADEIASVAAAAEKAVQGYAGGFSSVVGGKNATGDAAWHSQGATDGARMLADQIQKVQADPKFAQYNFTADEIKQAMTQKLAGGEELYDEVYNGSRARIKEAYIEAWKAHLSTFDKWFTDTKFDETLLRTRMGIKGPTSAAAMPDKANTGVSKDE